MARNPFHCDCRISWIADWLSANPVETSGARCEGPKKMHKRKLASMREEQLKCYGKKFETQIYDFFLFFHSDKYLRVDFGLCVPASCANDPRSRL